MIVNKVVLLISPARAREEELISQSAALVFAWLHCRPPWELAAEWTSLDSVEWGGGVPWVSDPLRHTSSLPAPRGRNTQPPLTTGLSRRSLKKASPHTTRRRQAADWLSSMCRRWCTLMVNTWSPWRCLSEFWHVYGAGWHTPNEKSPHPNNFKSPPDWNSQIFECCENGIWRRSHWKKKSRFDRQLTSCVKHLKFYIKRWRPAWKQVRQCSVFFLIFFYLTFTFTKHRKRCEDWTVSERFPSETLWMETEQTVLNNIRLPLLTRRPETHCFPKAGDKQSRLAALVSTATVNPES